MFMIVSKLMHPVVKKAMGGAYNQPHTFVGNGVGPRANGVQVCKCSFDLFKNGYCLVGIDYVALGLDFTPTWEEKDYDKAAKTYPEIYLDYNFKDSRPNGLRGILDVFNITRGLVAQGYTEKAIRKVLGENFLRVFAETWN